MLCMPTINVAHWPSQTSDWSLLAGSSFHMFSVPVLFSTIQLLNLTSLFIWQCRVGAIT